MRHQRFNIQLNGFSNIGEGFFFRFPLTDTTRQTRTFDHPIAVFAGMHDNVAFMRFVFHVKFPDTIAPSFIIALSTILINPFVLSWFNPTYVTNARSPACFFQAPVSRMSSIVSITKRISSSVL